MADEEMDSVFQKQGLPDAQANRRYGAQVTPDLSISHFSGGESTIHNKFATGFISPSSALQATSPTEGAALSQQQKKAISTGSSITQNILTN
jgi:hypothetical protein